MSMKKLLAASAGLFALVAGDSALAADLRAAPAYKAPPLVAPDIWNGFYVGLNAGGSVSRNRTTDQTNVPGFAAPLFDNAIFSHSPAGAIFGAQAGWNWHASPSWVLGLEADWQWSGQSETVCTFACLPASGAGALLSIVDDQSLKWFGTARGRIGWLSPGGSLWYATGGAAWGRVDQTLTLTATPGFFASGTGAAASFGENKLGWTIGAGVETPLANQWSLKAEYLYVDLGNVTNSFTTAISPAVVPPATTQITSSSSDIRDHIFRLGLNYHFGGPAGPVEVAGPMYTKAPPRAATAGWNGFYGGFNAGAAIARNPTTDTTLVPGAVFPVFGADTFSHASVGGVIGGQIGWNWRVAPTWVLGAEADWQWAHQTDSACVSECLSFGFQPATLLGLIGEQTIKWFGTARGRFGWVSPGGTLWYATGGLAWGRVEDSLALVTTPGFVAPGAATTASFSHDRIGWTIGAGVEAPLVDKWSVKAEYLYVDLGSVTDSFTSALAPGVVRGATFQTTTSDYSVHDHIVRFGINYHID